MQRQYESILQLASGKYKLVIDYYAEDSISFGPISVSDFEFGYEDEDLLTAYPNTIHFEFVDQNASSYKALLQAFNNSPGSISSPPYVNYLDKHGLTLYKIEPDFSYSIIFKGYIDKQSASYDSENMLTSFDAISSLLLLKDLHLSSADYGFTWNPLIGEGSVNYWEPEWVMGESILWIIFKKIYPNLPTDVYISQPGQPANTPGFHFYHNWNFMANGRVGVPEIFRNFPSDYPDIYYNFLPLIENSSTYGELIKKIAFEFGLSIGSSAYNSVFAIRRFSSISGLNSSSIDNSIISFSRSPYLKNISGVKCTYHYDSRISYTQGHFPTSTDGQPANSDIVINSTSLYGTNYIKTSQSPITKLYDASQNIYNDCLNGIYDPALDYAYRYPLDILSRWLYQSRNSIKEKFDFQLYGIDYDISKYYNATLYGNTIYMRPIKITKDLINNTTTLTALTYNV